MIKKISILLLTVAGVIQAWAADTKTKTVPDSLVYDNYRKEVFTYDDSLRQTSQTVYYKEDGQWVEKSRWQREYLIKTGQTTSYEYSEFVDGKWVVLNSEKYTYNDSIHVTSYVYETFDNTGIQTGGSKNDNVYNYGNDSYTRNQTSYSFKDGEWKLSGKYDNEYNYKGNELMWQSYTMVDDELKPYSHYEYYINEKGNRVTSYYEDCYGYADGVWTGYIYAYNTKGSQIARTRIYYTQKQEDGKTVVEDIFKEESKYNDNGQTTFDEKSKYVDGKWVAYEKSVITTDDNDNVTEDVHYVLNDEDEFVATSKKEYTYDKSGNQLSYVYSSPDEEGKWVASYKCDTEFVYSEDGSYTTTYMSYEFVDGEWIAKEKSEKAYDAAGHQLMSQSYTSVDGELKPYNRYEYFINEEGKSITTYSENCYGYKDDVWRGYTYTYDKEGNKLGQTYTSYSSKYDSETDSYVVDYFYKEEYTYDENGNQLSYFYSKLDEDGKWVVNSKSESKYDAAGNKLMSQSYTLVDGEFMPSSRTEYYINEKGKSITIYSENCYGYKDGVWQGETYTYDNEGNKLGYTNTSYSSKYDSETDSYVVDYFYKREYTYDENGTQLSYVYSKLDEEGKWVASSKSGTDYVYKEDGSYTTTYMSYDLVDGTWVAKEKSENTYDAAGHLLMSQSYTFVDGELKPYRRNEYFINEKGKSITTYSENCYGYKDGVWRGYTYTYDNEGNKLGETYTSYSRHYDYDKDEYVVDYFYKQEYAYDEKGNQLSYVYSKLDDAGKWVVNEKSESKYDAAGHQIMSQSYTLVDGELKPASRTEYYINEKGKSIPTYSENFYGYTDGVWRGETYTYDNEGNKLGYTYTGYNSKYDSDKGEYVVDYFYKQEYTYDGNDTQLSYVYSKLDEDGKWVASSKSGTDYAYNEDGSYTTTYMSYDLVDGEWVAKQKSENAYDAAGHQIMSQSYTLVDGELKPASRTEYYINEKGKSIPTYSENFYGYTDGVWRGETYTYDNEGNKLGYTYTGYNSKYDSDKGEYVVDYFYKQEYTYDGNDTQLSYVYSKLDEDGKWVASSKSGTEFVQNEDGSYTTTYMSYDLVDGELVAKEKSEKAYDAAGHQIMSQSYTLVDGELKPYERYEYFINEKGKSITTYSENCYGYTDGVWRGYTYTYDNEGNKLGKTYTSYYDKYDSETGSWVVDYFYKQEYTYDERGNQLLYVYSKLDEEGKWMASSKSDTEFVYNEDGGYAQTYVSYDYSDGEWIISYKRENEYDKWGHNALEVRYSISNGVASPSNKKEYTYDNNGEQLTYGYYYISDGEWYLNDGSKNEQIFTDGVLTSSLSYYWNGYEWVEDNSKIEYSYDDKGIRTSLYYNRDGEDWVLDHKTMESFDENGFKMLDAYYSLTNDGEWDGQRMNEYAYDAAGNQLMSQSYTLVDGEFKPYQRYEYFINENGKNITTYSEDCYGYKDGVWRGYTYTYDNEGNKLGETYTSYNDKYDSETGSWVVDYFYKQEYTYDGNDTQLSYVYSKLDEEGKWVASSKSGTEYVYNEDGSYTTTYMSYDLVDGTWVANEKSEKAYDAAGHQIMSQSYTLVDGELKPYDRYEYFINEKGKSITTYHEDCRGYTDGVWRGETYTYDNEGSKLGYTYTSYSRHYDYDKDEYVVDYFYKQEYAYDEKGNQLSYVYSKLDDAGKWVVNEKSESKYDAAGHQIMSQSYTLVDGELKPYERYEYFINEKGQSITTYHEDCRGYTDGVWRGYTDTNDNEGYQLSHTYTSYETKYDSEKGEYVVDYFYKQEYTYDGNGTQLSYVYSKLDEEGKWVASSKSGTDYVYKEDGSYTTTYMSYDLVDGTWVAKEKSENTYDAAGHLLMSQSYTFVDGELKPYRRNEYFINEKGKSITTYSENCYGYKDGVWRGYTYTYDNEGNKLGETYTSYDDKYDSETGSWVVDYFYKQEYTYDERGNQLSYVYSKLDDAGKWVANSKSESKYDAAGHQLMYQSYTFVDGELKPYQRYEYYINEKGKSITTYKENCYGYTDGVWCGYTYTYDNEGNQLGQTYTNYYNRYDSDKGEYVVDYFYKQEYTYDEKGNQLTYDYSRLIDGEFKPYNHYEYAINENGNRVTVYEESCWGYQDGQWTGYINTYDNNGHNISYETIYSAGNGYGSFYEWTYDEEKDEWIRNQTSYYNVSNGEKYHYTPKADGPADVTITLWNDATSAWSESVIKGVYFYDGIGDAISDIQADEHSSVAYGLKNAIRIENALGRSVIVCSINGSVVASIKMCDEATVNVGSKGIYIVKIGKESHKVVVR